jgi:hypothetical protein
LPLPLENGLDVRATYHVDHIQEIVSRFASKPFSVEVHFRQRDGVEYPVIQVESGIKTPVACKADLEDEKGEKEKKGKKLLSANEIYVRTLNANGIASSSKISGNDLDDVVERCFQNREADHAIFLSKLIRDLSKADTWDPSRSVFRILQNALASEGDPSSLYQEHSSVRRRSRHAR